MIRAPHPVIPLAVICWLVLLIAIVALTGCTTTRLVETPLADRIPAGLLTGRDRPVPGALDRQSDVARYVVELDAAGEDCRSKLGGVREIVESDRTE